MKTPEMCRFCHWRLSGCILPEKAEVCTYYEPQDLEEDLPPDERAYDPGEETDVWGEWGYEVFESEEDLERFFKGV